MRLLLVTSLSILQMATAQPALDPGLNVPADHIRIPVVVSDKQGKPVSGLQATDFTVLDNGRPASIVAEFAHSISSPGASHFTIFYFDDRRLTMEEVNGAKKDVIAALPAALDSNGYAAIVTGTGSVSSKFSRDIGELSKTLASIHSTSFAAQGNRAHNFDIVGTYTSLADYAAQMSTLPGQRLLVVFSPGFSADFSEVRSTAAISINRIVQSGVILNVLNIQDSASLTRGEDGTALEELSSATGGFFFPGPAAPPALTRPPEMVYMLDIPTSGIRPDGSLHQLKLTVALPGARIRSRKSFVAPSSSK